MAVKTYDPGVVLSPHFRSSEFRCKCGCGQIRIDPDLIATLEGLTAHRESVDIRCQQVNEASEG